MVQFQSLFEDNYIKFITYVNEMASTNDDNIKTNGMNRSENGQHHEQVTYITKALILFSLHVKRELRYDIHDKLILLFVLILYTE